jgi:hypothetical protein
LEERLEDWRRALKTGERLENWRRLRKEDQP